MIQVLKRVSCFEFFILSAMSHLVFANMFKVIGEYCTQPKEDGEEILIATREENFFNENNDHNKFVSETEEFLLLHDFLGEEKQDQVLIFK